MHRGDENKSTRYFFCPLKAMFIYKDNDTYSNLATPLAYYNVNITDITWSSPYKESHKDTSQHIPEGTPPGYLLVGRRHNGDQDGLTSYAIGRIEVLGKKLTNLTQTSVIIGQTDKEHHQFDENNQNYFRVKESDSWDTLSPIVTIGQHFTLGSVKLPKYAFITSRYHHGDENGSTWYSYSYIKCELFY